jgi:hypothetical protein
MKSKRDRLDDRFYELHEYGSKKYGFLWFKANDNVIKAARAFGKNPTTIENKAFLSQMALAMCVMQDPDKDYMLLHKPI